MKQEIDIQARVQIELDMIEAIMPEANYAELFMEALSRFAERDEHELIAYLTRKAIATTNTVIENSKNEETIKKVKQWKEQFREIQKIATMEISKEEQEEARKKDYDED